MSKPVFRRLTILTPCSLYSSGPRWWPQGESDPLTLWHGLGALAKAAVMLCYIVSMGPFYLGFFQTSPWQASIGKRLLNIYVTDMAGRRLGLLRSLARSFAKDFFNVFYIGIISVGLILGLPTKQALHDLATVVLNGRPAAGGAPEWWRMVSAFGIQFLWFVATFVLVFRTYGKSIGEEEKDCCE